MWCPRAAIARVTLRPRCDRASTKRCLQYYKATLIVSNKVNEFTYRPRMADVSLAASPMPPFETADVHGHNSVIISIIIDSLIGAHFPRPLRKATARLMCVPTYVLVIRV